LREIRGAEVKVWLEAHLSLLIRGPLRLSPGGGTTAAARHSPLARVTAFVVVYSR
jgi:hypothetical protein